MHELFPKNRFVRQRNGSQQLRIIRPGKSMTIKRRDFIALGTGLAGAAMLPGVALGKKPAQPFPEDFLWGASVSGHQVEGNNTASDTWFLENLQPTVFKEPSGDACNSFFLWQQDLKLVKSLGLNSFRFSIEWARIEPEEGQFSVAMLDYYQTRIDRCAAMGIRPVVTFCHFTAPLWFSSRGGWLNAKSPDYFVRYCRRAMAHLGKNIGYAITLNEPNLLSLLSWHGLPPVVIEKQDQMLEAAARQLQVEEFSSGNAMKFTDLDRALPNMLKAHRDAVAAIKSLRSDLPVGVSIAMIDDHPVGENSIIEQKRARLYGAWLETAQHDDFLGVQNYERALVGDKGDLPAPEGAVRGLTGGEIYPPSLAGAVKYAHSVTQKPILVTEHGVGSEDDNIRSWVIAEGLAELQKIIVEGVPVLGYMHWTLMDNFEWIFGYGPKFGLHSVDRETFKRTPKPSAKLLGSIARRNAIYG